MSDSVYVPVVIGGLNTASPYAISKVTLALDDKHVYTNGDDSGFELIVPSNPYANSAMAALLYAHVNGVSYNPFEATNAVYDPACELGDEIFVGDRVASILYKETQTFDIGFRGDVAAPGRYEMEDEYPYKTFEEKTRFVVEGLNDAITQNRTAIEQKSSEVIESEHTRIAKMAQNVKVSANGNALMLNQLCSGVVDSQIVLPQTPSDAAEEKLAEVPVEVQEEVSDVPTVADSEQLALPGLGEQTTELGEQTTAETVVTETAPEDMPFPELPSVEPETAQPSAQIAAGDVVLDALPPLEDSDAEPLTAENSNIADSNANNTSVQQTDLPALPDVEDLAPLPMVEENVEIPAGSQSSSLPQLPSLEELGPKSGVQANAPTELSAPNAAMEINSRDANYQSPEMEFLDDEPMEEALPVDEVKQTGDAIPLVAPNTTPQRVTPPSLPVIIED